MSRAWDHHCARTQFRRALVFGVQACS
jgi:hypothetical protein